MSYENRLVMNMETNFRTQNSIFFPQIPPPIEVGKYANKTNSRGNETFILSVQRGPYNIVKERKKKSKIKIVKNIGCP